MATAGTRVTGASRLEKYISLAIQLAAIIWGAAVIKTKLDDTINVVNELKVNQNTLIVHDALHELRITTLEGKVK